MEPIAQGLAASADGTAVVPGSLPPRSQVNSSNAAAPRAARTMMQELQSFVDQIPAPVSVIGLNGQQLFGNDAYRSLFRLGSGDLTGFFVNSLRGSDHEARARQRVELLEGIVDEVVVNETYVRADGTSFPGQIRERAFRDDGGRAVALIGVILDRSPEVAAEDAQLAAQRKLVGVLDAQRELVCEWRPEDGVLLFANEAYREFFGYGPEVVGQSILDLIPPEDVPKQLEVNAQIGRELGSYNTQRTYDDGRIVAWSDTVLRHPSSGEIVVVSSGRDETRSAVMARQLQESERRTRLLLNNLAGALTLLDAEGRVMERIGRDAKVLGVATDPWTNQLMEDRTHPDDRSTLDDMRRRVLGSPGGVATAELRLRQRDGRYDVFEVTAVNRLDDPYLQGIVLTTRDVTARKAVESELAARRDEAVEQNRRHQAFLAMASHELRNPLQGMVAIAELLADADLPANVAPLIEALQMQTDGMRRTVDDLLEFSSLAAGGLRLTPSAVEVRSVVANVVETARSANRRSDLTIASSVSTEVPALLSIDVDRLGQVLTNLVGNAAKFAPQGHVHVDVTTSVDGTQLHIEVSDDGPGISHADQTRVFEPFVQVGQREQQGGAGLGLTIVKLLVTSMGGSIGVRSTPGAGATFVVDLPLDPVTPADAEQVAVHAGSSDACVLVVEDDPTNQMVARLQLERLGARAVIAPDAETALRLLSSERFDLVLMDYLLPGMDGMELTRAIRSLEAADPSRGRTPIVALTGSVGVATREACLVAGMDDVLAKPAPLAQLSATLQRWGHGVAVAESHTRGGVVAPVVFDASRLELLADELGSGEPVIVLVRGFLDQLDKREHRLVDAHLTGDTRSLTRVAHDLKSVSQLIGVDELGALCRRIEDGESARLPSLVTVDVGPACDRVRGALRAWLAQHM